MSRGGFSDRDPGTCRRCRGVQHAIGVASGATVFATAFGVGRGRDQWPSRMPSSVLQQQQQLQMHEQDLKVPKVQKQDLEVPKVQAIPHSYQPLRGPEKQVPSIVKTDGTVEEVQIRPWMRAALLLAWRQLWTRLWMRVAPLLAWRWPSLPRMGQRVHLEEPAGHRRSRDRGVGFGARVRRDLLTRGS